MNDMYILDSDRAKELLKETLKGQWSLYRRISALIRHGMNDINGKDVSQIVAGIADSVIPDLAHNIARPLKRESEDIPFTEEYPQMVLYEIVRRVGPLKVSLDNMMVEGKYVRMMNIPLRNNLWHITYRHRSLYSLEWGEDPGQNDVWNILSYGWSNFYSGTRKVCLDPELAAELLLMLDDMAGYLDEEIVRTYYRVRRNQMCHQIRQVTDAALSASSEDQDPRRSSS